MKNSKLSGLNQKSENLEVTQSPLDKNQNYEESEGVTKGTKVKVMAALFIVTFATYVAFWVQVPTETMADVLSATQEAVTTKISAITTETTPTVESDATTIEKSKMVEISIIDFTYDPLTIQVEKGTRVIWTNKDIVPHTVTSDKFTSGTLNPGDTYEYTFNEDGAFNYNCSFHPQMKGSVMVGAGAVSANGPTGTQTQEQLTETMEETLPVASTPTEELLPSAPESAVSDKITPVSASPEAILAAAAQPTATQETMANGAEVEESELELTKSGPEHMLYAGILLVILYFNRRKLAGVRR